MMTTKVSKKEMISQDEARLMLVEQKNDEFHLKLIRIEKALENLVTKMDSKLEKVESSIESNFKWLLGFIIPSFMGVLGIIAHGLHWL